MAGNKTPPDVDTILGKLKIMLSSMKQLVAQKGNDSTAAKYHDFLQRKLNEFMGISTKPEKTSGASFFGNIQAEGRANLEQVSKKNIEDKDAESVPRNKGP
jgi:hypothetical protein